MVASGLAGRSDTRVVEERAHHRVNAVLHNEAQVVGEQSGSKAKYVFKGQELMVRAKITSTKLKENPYQEGDLEMAWIQPIQPKK